MTGKQIISMTLMVWNLVVFVTYGMDKRRAEHQAYRISEKTLLGMSILGGGLGAWAGGTRFRHKTKKWYFQLAWLLGLIIDGLLIYWIGR
ncbi:DUF1294 domain-containing protein [Streptococcus sp. ZJ93]|uniref:DUF1294 domain-containing protein n=1 Tax=Streptococcus handemini TaxID=3161188 RepID=UPI0034D79FE9